ncbi:MAG: hypothetical protein J5522_02715 [Lachnospiraceae bacterium]|nr:hypothetical protein [Lachnospiraceae bacterium]MBR4816452.1 hypothetical protein [Lachnospiraceae bacterium]
MSFGEFFAKYYTYIFILVILLYNVVVEKEDYAAYTVQLHDLTGAARLIGAFDLSKRAEILENAGREENADRIKADTEKVLKEYKRLYDGLFKVFNTKNN